MLIPVHCTFTDQNAPRRKRAHLGNVDYGNTLAVVAADVH